MPSAPIRLLLSVLPREYAIVRLPAGSGLPTWLPRPTPSAVVAVLWSDQEISVMAPTTEVPDPLRDRGAQRSDGWRCLRIEATFDVDVPGVLRSVVAPLADAGLSVMAVASFDTDHLLVHDLPAVVAALTAAGHEVRDAEAYAEPTAGPTGLPPTAEPR